MNLRWDNTNVRTRVLNAPPEFYELRRITMERERKRQEMRRPQRDPNQQTLSCGCVITTDPHNHYRSVTVHFCPTHWRERKRA